MQNPLLTEMCFPGYNDVISPFYIQSAGISLTYKGLAYN